MGLQRAAGLGRLSGLRKKATLARPDAPRLDIPAAWAATVRTFPLFPPPQKKRSRHRTRAPKRPTPGGNFERFEDSRVSGIDSPQIASVTFPGAVARALTSIQVTR